MNSKISNNDLVMKGGAKIGHIIEKYERPQLQDLTTLAPNSRVPYSNPNSNIKSPQNSSYFPSYTQDKILSRYSNNYGSKQKLLNLQLKDSINDGPESFASEFITPKQNALPSIFNHQGSARYPTKRQTMHIGNSSRRNINK